MSIAVMKHIRSALTALALSGCSGHEAAPTEAALATLIEHPQQFSESTVRTEGYLLLSSEGGFLFRSKEAESALSLSESVKLLVSPSQGSFEDFDGTYARVTGQFSVRERPGIAGWIAVRDVVPVERFRPAQSFAPLKSKHVSVDEIKAVLDEASK